MIPKGEAEVSAGSHSLKSMEEGTANEGNEFTSVKSEDYFMMYRTRWQINIVIPFSPGGNINIPTVSKGKTFTPR